MRLCFEYFQGQKCHSHFRQSVPVFDHPQGKIFLFTPNCNFLCSSLSYYLSSCLCLTTRQSSSVFTNPPISQSQTTIRSPPSFIFKSLFLICHVLHLPNHFSSRLLNCCSTSVSLVLGHPKLGRALSMNSHTCQIQGPSHSHAPEAALLLKASRMQLAIAKGFHC